MSDDEPLQHPKGRGLRKGVTTNPSGVTTTERVARRRIGEVLRELHTPEEFGRAMWAILEGEDPFADKRRRKKPVDGLPMLGAPDEPIKWEHRLAAGKLYAEYSWGKPLQGVVVEAHMEQRVQVEGGVTTGPVDFRSMPPEVRAALRMAAAAALGRPIPPLALPAGSVRVVDDRQVDRDAGEHRPADPLARAVDVDAQQVGGESAAEPLTLGVGQSRADAVVDLDDALRTDVDGVGLDDGVADARPAGVHDRVQTTVDLVGTHGSGHGLTLPAPATQVKVIRLDFRGSANLVDAELVGDDPTTSVLTVRFKAPGGAADQVQRAYRYRNVTPAMMRAWSAAPSAGAWFAREIRAQHMRYPVVKDATT